MSSSFPDSFDQFGEDSRAAGSTQPFGDGAYSSLDSPVFTGSHNGAFGSQPIPETPSPPPPIYLSGGGPSPDPLEFSTFSPVANGKVFDGGYAASDGPILPPPAEMENEEGFALREWRRQNAIRLEEKERREKELLSQIITEADDYKVEFYRRRQGTCEINKATNREKEELFLINQEKFHTEADKNYWKAIAELIPNEVPAIQKKRGKKEQEKKPGLVVVQGPKPGKPTDLARMRHILLKLKHNTPPHLKPSLPPAPTNDPKADATVTTPNAAVVATPVEAVVVA